MSNLAEKHPPFSFKTVRVQDGHRIGFFPRMFPGFYLSAENTLFDNAKRCIPKEAYSGYFDFFKVFAGGSDKPAPLFQLSGTGSVEFTNLFGTTQTISFRCASCILTSLTLIRLAEKEKIGNKTLSDDTREQLIDWYYTILDVGREFAEVDGCADAFFNLTD